MSKIKSKETEIIEEVNDMENKSLSSLVSKARAEAMKTKVVMITSNDKRENSGVDTCYLSCVNMYFQVAKVVPLNIEVELEQCLIDVAKESIIVVHVLDTNPKSPTAGLSIAKSMPRYNVAIVKE